MRTMTTRAIRRIRMTWAELDHAQRRLFEIRTGVPLGEPRKASRISRRVDELEALFRL